MRQFPADGHQAAVGRQPDLFGIEPFEYACDPALDRIGRGRRRIARIDAAEHDDAVAAQFQHLRIEGAAAEFHGEAADARLHQQRQQVFVFVLVLPLAAAGIAVTQMHDGRHRDAVEAAVERFGAIGGDLVVIARHRRLVDLQHRAAGGRQIAELAIDGDGGIEG